MFGYINHKNLFYLLLVLLPLNLSKHFIFPWNYVDGILVDYLIPTVYFTDILVWLILILWLPKFVSGLIKTKFFLKFPFIYYSVSFFLLFSALSIYSADLKVVALLKLIKVVQFVLFAIYVSKNFDLKKDLNKTISLITASFLFESIIGIFQFVNQNSILGYFPFGGPVFNSATPQIAKASFFGVKKVVPYGTFPHPNILGGFLSLAIPLLIFYLIRLRKEETKGGWFKLLYCYIAILLGLAALVLTRSNSALISLMVGICGIWIFRDSWKKSILIPFIFAIFTFLFLIFTLPLNFSPGSFSQRIDLIKAATQMIKGGPLIGVGLANFTATLSDYDGVSGFMRILQPVHNIFMLVAAETGILSLAAFLAFLLGLLRKLFITGKLSPPAGILSFQFSIMLAQLLILGMFDHYLITIQQGMLIFWLVVGLALSSINVVKSK